MNISLPQFADVQALMSGRELREEDWPYEPQLLKIYIENGLINKKSGLVRIKQQWRCARCGNHNPELMGSYSCARCGKDCRYCRSCLMMGVIKSCTHLLHWSGPMLPLTAPSDLICHWSGKLTSFQNQASLFTENCLMSDQDGLIWAVCGAGKTEILFQGITTLLQSGKRLAIATPRTDVVNELYPRLKQAFPDINICAQFGDGPPYDPHSPLIITTTHQLFKFSQAFNAIIIDEVDAFPFSHDATLAFAVEKARLPNAPKLYLTATPNLSFKRRFLQSKLNGIKIPIRFHGKPLPVPRLKWAGDWRKIPHKKKLPRILKKWIENKDLTTRRLFIFVPHISLLETIKGLIINEGYEAESVYAEDPDRHDKVMRFREGVIRILITTTIMERGVTISRADVAVLGADDQIFNESALVQISGRTGRDQAFPEGDVVFFHYGKTREMIKARNHLIQMNKEAGLV